MSSAKPSQHPLTNQTLWSTDFARDGRIAFLRSMQERVDAELGGRPACGLSALQRIARFFGRRKEA